MIKLILNKDTPGIGCGIWPFISGPNDCFFDACCWHDEAYEKGSFWQRTYTREFVDKLFLLKMLSNCKGKPGGAILKAKAYFYYYAARALGGPFWEADKRFCRFNALKSHDYATTWKDTNVG
jgi:hypothetical protein